MMKTLTISWTLSQHNKARIKVLLKKPSIHELCVLILFPQMLGFVFVFFFNLLIQSLLSKYKAAFLEASQRIRLHRCRSRKVSGSRLFFYWLLMRKRNKFASGQSILSPLLPPFTASQTEPLVANPQCLCNISTATKKLLTLSIHRDIVTDANAAFFNMLLFTSDAASLKVVQMLAAQILKFYIILWLKKYSKYIDLNYVYAVALLKYKSEVLYHFIHPLHISWEIILFGRHYI